MDRTKRERESSNSSDRDSETASPVDKKKKDENFETESEEVFTRGVSNMALSDDIGVNIKHILQKLEKLDSMETMLNKALSKVAAVETHVNELALKVEALDSKSRVADKSVEELTASVDFISKMCEDATHRQKEDSEKHKAELARLSKQMSYLEAYSRRENLLFEGIHEAPNEDGREDTAAVLRSFMETVLNVEKPDTIEFQRVHRLGKKTSKGPRVIIARFLRYSDRQRIASLGKYLRDKEIYIYPDLPKSIQEARRRQMSKLKEARKAGQSAYFSQSKPDMLYIDGKFVPE